MKNDSKTNFKFDLKSSNFKQLVKSILSQNCRPIRLTTGPISSSVKVGSKFLIEDTFVTCSSTNLKLLSVKGSNLKSFKFLPASSLRVPCMTFDRLVNVLNLDGCWNRASKSNFQIELLG